MKFAMLFLLAGIVINTVVAQSESFRFTAAESAMYIAYPGNTGITVRGLKAAGKHMFGAGIDFPVSSDEAEQHGAGIIYRFFPNYFPNAVNMFAQYGLSVKRRLLYTGSARKGITMHNMIGYGFTVNLAPKILLVHSIGAGFQRSWFKNHRFSDISLQADAGIIFIFEKTP